MIYLLAWLFITLTFAYVQFQQGEINKTQLFDNHENRSNGMCFLEDEIC